nr:MAG TPA: hypothetical protein [Caudoviricetes sp.]
MFNKSFLKVFNSPKRPPVSHRWRSLQYQFI